MSRSATAFAPASVGNIGVGFDLLGHAIDGPRDLATVHRIDEPVVRIDAHEFTQTAPVISALRAAGL